MTEQHPITLPPKVLQQLRSKAPAEGWFRDAWIAEQAAQWGSDMELEACIEWLQDPDLNVDTYKLRVARRPKPLSLKEQSIALLDLIQANKKLWQLEDLDVVRRALEQLPDHTNEEHFNAS